MIQQKDDVPCYTVARVSSPKNNPIKQCTSRGQLSKECPAMMMFSPRTFCFVFSVCKNEVKAFIFLNPLTSKCMHRECTVESPHWRHMGSKRVSWIQVSSFQGWGALLAILLHSVLSHIPILLLLFYRMASVSSACSTASFLGGVHITESMHLAIVMSTTYRIQL